MCRTPFYRARGFTLIEVLVALAVTTVILAVAGSAVESYGDRVANEAAAHHALTVDKAARAYIRDNQSALVAAAGPATPATITPATLAPYLPGGFNPQNGFGQSFTIKVIEPSAGQLDAIVLTTGGDAIDGQNLRRIAQLIGADGGYVSTAGPSAVAQGAFGGWSRNLSPFGGSAGAGKLVVGLFVSPDRADEALLHRAAVAGRPDLNRMSASIDMAGNNVASVDQVTANRVSLSSGNALQIGSSYFYGDSANSAIRQTGGLYVQRTGGGAAPINQVGNITSQGTLNASNDVGAGGTVSGNIVVANESYANGWFRTQGNGGWYSTAYGGGWHMSDASWIRAYNGKNVYTPGQLLGGSVRATSSIRSDQAISAGQSVGAGLDVAAARNVAASNNVSANGHVIAGYHVSAGVRVTAGEYLHPQGIATCNAACSPNGLIGRTPAGALLSCDSGSWKGYTCP